MIDLSENPLIEYKIMQFCKQGGKSTAVIDSW